MEIECALENGIRTEQAMQSKIRRDSNHCILDRDCSGDAIKFFSVVGFLIFGYSSCLHRGVIL